MASWVGCDLDKTLAYYDDSMGLKIGKPIPAMLKRVKKWIKDGQEVRIFTARAASPELIPAVKEWLKEQGLDLEVTCVKDRDCIAIYDDRAVSVYPNTGLLVSKYTPEKKEKK